jgi:uncharacterized protein (DUF2384 family)
MRTNDCSRHRTLQRRKGMQERRLHGNQAGKSQRLARLSELMEQAEDIKRIWPFLGKRQSPNTQRL